MALIHRLALHEYELGGVGQLLYLLAEGVPLAELVSAAGVVDIDEHLVVEGHGAHLVIGGGEELDHIVPGSAILRLVVAIALRLKEGDDAVEDVLLFEEAGICNNPRSGRHVLCCKY